MLATIHFLSDVNILAVLVAGLAYFALGALWYSVLFGKMWKAGIEETGIKMNQPGQSGMMMSMMVKSFIANVLTAFGVAYVIHLNQNYNVETGIKVGLMLGVCIAFASELMVANWQGTKTKVLVIDAGYQILGILLTAVILSCWH